MGGMACMLFFWGGTNPVNCMAPGFRGATVTDDHTILAGGGQTLGPFMGSFEGCLKGAAHSLLLQQLQGVLPLWGDRRFSSSLLGRLQGSGGRAAEHVASPGGCLTCPPQSCEQRPLPPSHGHAPLFIRLPERSLRRDNHRLSGTCHSKLSASPRKTL